MSGAPTAESHTLCSFMRAQGADVQSDKTTGSFGQPTEMENLVGAVCPGASLFHRESGMVDGRPGIPLRGTSGSWFGGRATGRCGE